MVSRRFDKEKGLVVLNQLTLIYVGRCDRIRTYDPLHPMQVRYRAAPHTEALNSTSACAPGLPGVATLDQANRQSLTTRCVAAPLLLEPPLQPLRLLRLTARRASRAVLSTVARRWPLRQADRVRR